MGSGLGCNGREGGKRGDKGRGRPAPDDAERRRPCFLGSVRRVEVRQPPSLGNS